jgi:hypothetical protein
MHHYTIELRIEGADLDTDEVTKTMGVHPTQVRRRGEPRRADDKWRVNMWALEVFPPPVQSQWTSLEEGIGRLLDVVGPLKNRMAKYREMHDVHIWCGHYSSSFDGGPTLSPALLKSLADFAVEVTLDTYCGNSEVSGRRRVVHPR